MIRVVRVREFIEVEFKDGEIRAIETRNSEAPLSVTDKDDFVRMYAESKIDSANREVDRRAAKMVQDAVLRLLGLSKGADL